MIVRSGNDVMTGSYGVLLGGRREGAGKTDSVHSKCQLYLCRLDNNKPVGFTVNSVQQFLR